MIDNRYTGVGYEPPFETQSDKDFIAAHIESLQAEIAALREQIENPKITYCAFCGERYDIEDREKAIGLITEHVQVCPKHPIAALREHQRVLVEILRRTWSFLCEIGSPNCNMELARKDVNMMAEEIRAALAAKEG